MPHFFSQSIIKKKMPPKKTRKPRTKKVETETIKLRKKEGAKENANIKIKKGALHRALKVPADYTFTKKEIGRLDKVETGNSFEFHGNTFKMTPLMKDRVSLAHTMMGWRK